MKIDNFIVCFSYVLLVVASTLSIKKFLFPPTVFEEKQLRNDSQLPEFTICPYQEEPGMSLRIHDYGFHNSFFFKNPWASKVHTLRSLIIVSTRLTFQGQFSHPYGP